MIGLIYLLSAIGSEYAYFWLAALVSIACYGWIVFRWLQEAGEQGDKLLVRDALAMGWYPAGEFLIALLLFFDWNQVPYGRCPISDFVSIFVLCFV